MRQAVKNSPRSGQIRRQLLTPSLGRFNTHWCGSLSARRKRFKLISALRLILGSPCSRVRTVKRYDFRESARPIERTDVTEAHGRTPPAQERVGRPLQDSWVV